MHDVPAAKRRTAGKGPSAPVRAERRPERGKGADSTFFMAGAANPEQFPAAAPQIAVAGRSNVGKSSLLNRLVGRHGLARVSKTPGRTQQINFFSVAGQWVLVDLPGYGFARVPRAVQQRWQTLVEAYLTRSRALRGAVVLVDVRRGVEPDDALLLEFLRRQQIPVVLVVTKIDKLPRGQRRFRVQDTVRAHPKLTVVACSAITGDGIAELRAAVRNLLRDADGPEHSSGEATE